jgi:hypothetical protein
MSHSLFGVMSVADNTNGTYTLYRQRSVAMYLLAIRSCLYIFETSR